MQDLSSVEFQQKTGLAFLGNSHMGISQDHPLLAIEYIAAPNI